MNIYLHYSFDSAKKRVVCITITATEKENHNGLKSLTLFSLMNNIFYRYEFFFSLKITSYTYVVSKQTVYESNVDLENG